MTTLLNDKTVIVTRPQEQATSLCQSLTDLGASVILFPTLEILPMADQNTLCKSLAALQTNDTVIFASSNAVIQSFSTKPDLNLPNIVIAMGPATQQSLSDYHIDSLIPNQFNSEALLTMSCLQNLTDKSVAIVAGVGGRELLENQLRTRGANVNKVESYQRTIPNADMNAQIPDWQTQAIDAIIVTSGESLQNLVTMTNDAYKPWLFNQQLLVISDRIANIAAQLGFKKLPLIADNATNKAILSQL